MTNGMIGSQKRLSGARSGVGSRLGCGFLEKCYENALAYELRRDGLKVEQQGAVESLV